MTKIFISHSSKDTEFARQLAQALNNAGFETWLDINSLAPGTTWNQAIQEGLDASEAMILILSPEAMTSETVNAEWLYFLSQKKRLFTILWRPVEKLPFQLQVIQWVNFHNVDFALAFEKLLPELRQQKPLATPGSSTILPPPFEWVAIPGGEVTLSWGGILSKTEIAEVYSFHIAKYPITNGQYEAFVNHGDGYANPEWWSFNDFAKRWREKHPERPVPDNRGWDHPRTNVPWCDAQAFCFWLMAQEGTSTYRIRLPSEHQWLRAAVGDRGWSYPWGRLYRPGRSNGYESGRRSTTSVTHYPDGASPYGVMDMVGNVWEWMVTSTSGVDMMGAPSPYRIIRGGSYRNLFPSCSSRTYESFATMKPFLGFRVAAV